VCEAYRKNLNSFNPKLPMEYRKINPVLKDFKEPRWESVRFEGAKRIPPGSDVLIRISNFLWERDANPAHYVTITEWPKWRGTKKQLAAAYKSYFYERHESGKVMPGHQIVDIDIDNDGRPEPVYLDRLYDIPGVLLVLKPNYSDIDDRKTKLVLMHPSFKELGLGYFEPVKKEGGWGIAPSNVKRGFDEVHTALTGAFYGVFFFKDKTYFDLWGFPDERRVQGWRSLLDSRLHVFIAEKGNTTEICTYKFVQEN
jgi:hypothetical protein